MSYLEHAMFRNGVIW